MNWQGVAVVPIFLGHFLDHVWITFFFSSATEAANNGGGETTEAVPTDEHSVQ
jgi:hypothetical protein